jgi:hypothetical protein
MAFMLGPNPTKGESSSWALKDGSMITLSREGSGYVVKDPKGNALLDFPDPLVVTQTVVSSDRTCILMLVDSEPPAPPGKKIRHARWYSHLALVHRDTDGRWKAQRVLSGNKAPMVERQRAVAEVHRVSNSGLKALLLISELEREELPAKVLRVWRTMNLSDGKIVAEGYVLPKDFED